MIPTDQTHIYCLKCLATVSEIAKGIPLAKLLLEELVNFR
jgi:hypothetical protein